jgi:hypothetical protein
MREIPPSETQAPLPGGAGGPDPTMSGPSPQEYHSPQPVAVTCDACDHGFEVPIASALNRHTTRCPHCGWCAWLPRDCWPIGGKP